MATLTIVYNQNNNPPWSITTTNGTNVYANPLDMSASGTITWQINTAQCNPSDIGFSNTPGPPGVVFTPTTNTPTDWTQVQPAPNATNSQWSVTDAVSAATEGKFAYTITLVTNGGTVFTTDPDVTNTPD